MLSMLLLALVLSQSADAPAAPQAPAVAKRPAMRTDEVWNLEYEPGAMRLYRDPSTGHSYWYATFTIFNRSGKDRHAAPRWELVDEEGRVTPEGRGVPGDVSKAIQRLLNDPQLQESHAVMGSIAQGPANAKTGFVVFPAGPELRRFSLMVSGLSNGEDSIKDVKTGQRVIVHRTLRIDYQVPGDRGALRGPVPLAEADSGTSNPGWIYR
jgi:hypothetical protein